MRYILLLFLAALLILPSCKKQNQQQQQINGTICYQSFEKTIHTEGGSVDYGFLFTCDSTNTVEIGAIRIEETNVMYGRITGNTISFLIADTNNIGTKAPLVLTPNTPINEYTGRYNQMNIYMYKGGLTNAIIGFKLSRLNYYNYGWMRITYSADLKTFTLHDLAVNIKEDEAISAGQY